jgi:hypothetical protein
MERLLTILQQALPPITAGATKRIDGVALQKRLAQLSNRNAGYFRLATAMLAATYLTVLVLLWIQRLSVVAFPLLLVAASITWWAVALWREKSYADVILAFARDFPEEVLRSVILTGSKAVEANIKGTASAKDLAGLVKTGVTKEPANESGTAP